jgi:hypothetical protein
MIRSQRGGTLIEAMFAMTVMLTGAAAMAGLHRQALFFNGDGRKMTRASALASDLLANLEALPTSSPLLANANASNDADIADSGNAAEADTWDPVSATDHSWTELPGGWPGLTGASAVAGGTTFADTDYQVFWNVSQTAGATYSYTNVAAIVRWRHGSGWRRVVSFGIKPGDPYIP